MGVPVVIGSPGLWVIFLIKDIFGVQCTTRSVTQTALGSLGRSSTAMCKRTLTINIVVQEGILTTAGWQVTLCDPIWHVSFPGSGES